MLTGNNSSETWKMIWLKYFDWKIFSFELQQNWFYGLLHQQWNLLEVQLIVYREMVLMGEIPLELQTSTGSLKSLSNPFFKSNFFFQKTWTTNNYELIFNQNVLIFIYSFIFVCFLKKLFYNRDVLTTLTVPHKISIIFVKNQDMQKQNSATLCNLSFPL